jgi:alpha-tubulin suppressor-like RCC1 family protein
VDKQLQAFALRRSNGATTMLHTRTTTLITATLLALPCLAAPAKLSIGGEHMLLLRTDGTVASWGRNQWGQVGTNASSPVAPATIPGLSGVVDVIADGSTSLVLKADGTVWAFGSGGLVPTGRSDGITKVSGLNQIMTIGHGYDSVGFAVDTAGKAYSWGDKYLLGYAISGSSSNAAAPIPGLANVLKISAGSDEAIALLKDGTAYGWGYNRNVFNTLGTGVFGDPTTPHVVTALQNKLVDVTNGAVNSSGVHYGLSAAGTVEAWGDTGSGIITCGQARASVVIPQPLVSTFAIANLTGVKAMAGGDGNTLFLTQSGSVYGCGNNSNGELGDGTQIGADFVGTPPKIGPIAAVGLPPVIAIASGGRASGAVTASGDVYTWGARNSGRLGDGIDSSAYALSPYKVAISAGAQASAGPIIAGTQTGNLTNVTIDVGVGIAPADVGAQGQVYVAVVLPSGALYLVTSTGGFVPYDSAHMVIPAYYAGTLNTHHPVHLIDSLNLDGLAGTSVLVGYGLGTGDAATAEMLQHSRVGTALILQ